MTQINAYDLNASLNLLADDGSLQLEKDKEAVRQYFLQDVNNNMVFFHTLEEKLNHLFTEGYYKKEIFDQYKFSFVKSLYKRAYAKKYRFETYLGAFKFYTSYAMKTKDGKKIIERYEDRVVAVALTIGKGDTELATELLDEIMSGRFQPATPTFLNAGKVMAGEQVSCFPAGTKVRTKSDNVNIEDIKVGDEVLTHDGSHKAVAGVKVSDYNGVGVEIVVAGRGSFVATEEHPLLVVCKDDAEDRFVAELDGVDGATKNVRWVAAKDVKAGDYVVISKPKYETENYEISVIQNTSLSDLTVEARDLFGDGTMFDMVVKKNKDPKTIKAGFVYNKNYTPIFNDVSVSEDFGFFVGYYLAEGYVIKDAKTGRSKGVNFTFGSKEHGYIKHVSDIALKLFNLESKTKQNIDGSTNVYVNSIVLGDLFDTLFGSGFDKKKLPASVFGWSGSAKLALLAGTFRGDGHTTSNHVEASLTNPALVQQLVLLSDSLGYNTRVRSHSTASGKIANTMYIMGSISDGGDDFVQYVGKNLFNYNGMNETHSPMYVETIDGYTVFRVSATRFVGMNEKVYNLHVEDNHTYTVSNGVVVHNCFLMRVEDNMESISRTVNGALQLSKRGGGVAILLSNLREAGAPIKGIENQSTGVVPIMKILEDSFSYANQLGARQGAGAVYLNAHHPDILKFLDTKRENADEKIRIKTLSLGVVIPDITFELSRNNEPMYLFSPYDVELVYGKPFAEISITEKYREMVDNPKIRKKKIDARAFFNTIAEVQFESGYPYILFEDHATAGNIGEGRINMSNLCTEILQENTASVYNEDLSYDVVGRDISCNLGSQNIDKQMQSPDFGKSVEIAVRSLTNVSKDSNIVCVPSIQNGNQLTRAIGLGQMNLHGFFGKHRIHYGSPESLDFTNIYFYTIAYYSIKASNKLAIEYGETFDGFENSKYASGKFFDKYLEKEWKPKFELVGKLFENIHIPTQEDWAELKESVMKYGTYNKYLQAIPPTGSISYINNSTASIHPVAAAIEVRKEGKIGRVYYPAPNLTNDNIEYYEDSYKIGPEKIIDVYAEATQHTDQGLSLTLFFNSNTTTRDFTKAQIYAWKKGIKTLYYVRVRQESLAGTEDKGCVSCAL